MTDDDDRRICASTEAAVKGASTRVVEAPPQLLTAETIPLARTGGKQMLPVDTPEGAESPTTKRHRLTRRRMRQIRLNRSLERIAAIRQQDAAGARTRRAAETAEQTQARRTRDAMATAARRDNEMEAQAEARRAQMARAAISRRNDESAAQQKARRAQDRDARRIVVNNATAAKLDMSVASPTRKVKRSRTGLLIL